MGQCVPELWQSWNITERTGKVNPYFTSLWTLQESTLRPDMVFCNASWQNLQVNDSEPVSLGHIVALCSTLMEVAPPSLSRPTPLGSTLLEELVFKIGFFELLDFSRMALLSLGNERECSHNRAEAIM